MNGLGGFVLEAEHGERLVAAAVLFAGIIVAGLLPAGRRLRRAVSVPGLLRAVTAACVAGALLSPVLVRRGEDGYAYLLVDVSSSVDGARAEESLRSALAAAGPLTPRIVPFAGSAGPVVAPSDYPSLRGAWTSLDQGKTDLAAGFSSSDLPDGSAVVLVSDGFPTASGEEGALAAAAARGLRVHPVLPPSGTAPSPTFAVEQVSAPLVAPPGAAVPVAVSVTNKTRSVAAGKLVVRQGEKVLATRRVSVPAGGTGLESLEGDPKAEGISKITAAFTPDDRSLAPSTLHAFVSSEVREKVLLVAGSPEDGRLLGEVLRSRAFDLTVADAASAGVLDDPSRFSAVVLANVPYGAIGPSRSESLGRFVRAGGGLVTIGGARSFGPGDYVGTPLEDLLPVRPLPPRTVKKRANVAVQMVLDKSRSMADARKMDFAKDAAREVIGALKDEDYVGVIGFDSTPFVVVRLDLVASNRDVAADRVDRLFPAGKTQLLPALDEARRGLQRAQAGRKHVIVLTDGRLPDAGPYYLELVRQMKLTGITLSSVLVGSTAGDDFLRQLAQVGGGAFYETSDPRSLPRIFIEDVKVNTGERILRESDRLTVGRGRGTGVTDLRDFPPLRGFVETAERPGVDPELVVTDAEGARPLLASWKVGKGTSLAFASDASGRWSGPWVPWNGFRTFWDDVLTHVRPEKKDDSPDVRFDVRRTVRGGDLELEVAVYGRVPSLAGLLAGPKGAAEVSFTPAAPGRYVGTVRGVAAGDYTLKLRAGERELTPVGFHLQGELFGERPGAGWNVAFLRRLAEATGGVVGPTPEGIGGGAAKVLERRAIGVWLLGAGLLAAVLGVMARESWGGRSGVNFKRDDYST